MELTGVKGKDGKMDGPVRVECSYGCGYKENAPTREEGEKLILEHIKVCPNHPMRKVEQERDNYKACFNIALDTLGKVADKAAGLENKNAELEFENAMLRFAASFGLY